MRDGAHFGGECAVAVDVDAGEDLGHELLRVAASEEVLLELRVVDAAVGVAVQHLEGSVGVGVDHLHWPSVRVSAEALDLHAEPSGATRHGHRRTR